MTDLTKNLCGAKARTTGEPCRKAPVAGATRCRLHGGAAPQVKAKAERVLFEREARQLFGKIAPEIVPVDNPLAAYAAFAGEVMAWKQLMNQLLDDLRRPGYSTETSGEQVHAAVTLYERSMDRANTVLSAYARLNIDERLAKVTETQAKAISRALEAVIGHYGGTTEQATAARALAARHLRAVA